MDAGATAGAAGSSRYEDRFFRSGSPPQQQWGKRSQGSTITPRSTRQPQSAQVISMAPVSHQRAGSDGRGRGACADDDVPQDSESPADLGSRRGSKPHRHSRGRGERCRPVGPGQAVHGGLPRTALDLVAEGMGFGNCPGQLSRREQPWEQPTSASRNLARRTTAAIHERDRRSRQRGDLGRPAATGTARGVDAGCDLEGCGP
jgi:hypothetical protein